MKNFPDESCPVCHDEDYEVLNYENNFNYDDIEQWWDCRCIKCGCRFCITRTYTLTNVTVEKSE